MYSFGVVYEELQVPTLKDYSFRAPKHLMEEIERRATICGRGSRNAELRNLIDTALNYAGDEDIQVEMPEGEWLVTGGNFDHETLSMLKERAKRNFRSTGLEIVRLAAYAMEESAKRDLMIVEEMLRRAQLAQAR
jgi:hypothetical protein